MGLQEHITQSPSASGTALGVTLGTGDTLLAFPVPLTANVQSVVTAQVSLGYLFPGSTVVTYLLLPAALWRSCLCSWGDLIQWLNWLFISAVPRCLWERWARRWDRALRLPE